MDHWYALRSKPNKEWPLWQELQARSQECCFPRVRVHPVNPRSRTMRAYFPGYLFICADIAKVGASLFNWMPFSLGLVNFGGDPAQVPETLVHAIARRVEQINRAGGEQLEGLKSGERVTIQNGPFCGYEAVFDARLPGSERVRVLLKLLAVRQMKLELPVADIRRQKAALPNVW